MFKQSALSLLAIFSFFSFSFSQNKALKQYAYKNESYKVYPYGQKVSLSTCFRNALIFFPKASAENYLRHEFKKLTEDEIQEYLVSSQETVKRLQKESPYIYQDRAGIYAEILGKSDYFMLTRASLEVDIIPALDPLPDGKYIQFYDNYFQLNEKGELNYDSLKVAGIFSLKNNKLHGEATWFNLFGDTIKSGRFENGLKQGTWKLVNSNVECYSKKSAVEYTQKPLVKNIEVFEMRNGIKHGSYSKFKNNIPIYKGQYAESDVCGEWFVYEPYTYRKKGVQIDTFYLSYHYTLADSKNKKVSHKFLLRSSIFDEVPSSKKFEFPKLTVPNINFDEFFTIHFKEEEEDLELPEENMVSYGDEYEDEYYEDYDDEYTEYYEGTYWIGEEEFSRKKIMDSLGYVNIYSGIYEEFYKNGQLKFRYEYKDGDLVQEDTVFWDNGNPAHVVFWNEKEKLYHEKMFDLDRQLYSHITYDEEGKLVEKRIDPLYDENHTTIEGFSATIYSYNPFGNREMISYEYSNSDTLKYPLSNSVDLYRSWYEDKSLHQSVKYDPTTKTLTNEINSFYGNPFYKGVFVFGDDYENYSSYEEGKLQNFKIVTKGNAIYEPEYAFYYDENTVDTIPAMRVIGMKNKYAKTSDDEYFVDDKLFSGAFKLTLNDSKNAYSFNSKLIQIQLNERKETVDQWKEARIKALDFNVKTHPEIFQILEDEFELYNSFVNYFPFLFDLIDSDEVERLSELDKKSKTKIQIIGSFMNGKPTGEWLVMNEKKEVLLSCNYLNGELHGPYRIYQFEKPLSKQDTDDWESYDPTTKWKTYPKKETRYLYSESNFNKGIIHGDVIYYNWEKQITSKSQYENGVKNGLFFERNPLVYSQNYYRNGLIDGDANTYLTIPGKDSILLYTLAFKSGALQGESRSFHSNGKLSKRGFFLNGEAIDDYEGYDTLGFKYHYVKFQYGFPIEEKIWEANQLSVRYEFDWKDSIYFRPSDLTESQDIDNILYDLGLMDDAYSEPYYGRESLISKYGVKYHLTKYFPNDSIARDGYLSNNRKVGNWIFKGYNGELLYTANYFDTILKVNDSIKFKSKGIRYDYDRKGNVICKSYMIERFEKYDCSHNDHNEVRQYYTIWEANDTLHRMNGFVRNFYDNGTLQSEGNMKSGLPTGIWKFYDPYGKLNQVGEYVQGKRNGRWLSGDLSKTKYLGDICMNPNLPDLEERMETQEKMLDIYIRYFKLGKLLNSEYYDLNLNNYETEDDSDPMNLYEEELEAE